MNSSCSICSDLFTQRTAIYSTNCGHLFHHNCIMQWIERVKTCPLCRHRVTEKSIHRLYLNFVSAEGISDDIVTLQAKLDMINFQLSVKNSDISSMKDKCKISNTSCSSMREKIVEMEENNRVHESGMLALKYQLQNYQEKSRDEEKHVQEIQRLKKQLEKIADLKQLAQNCQDQIEEMMRNKRDPQSLRILITTLKKQLVDTEKDGRSLTSRLTTLSGEMFKVNSRIYKLRADNEKIRNSPEGHDNCTSEIEHLKRKIKEIKSQRRNERSNCTVTSRTVNCDSVTENGDVIDLTTSSTSSLLHHTISLCTPELPHRTSPRNIINLNETPQNIPRVSSRFQSLSQRLNPVMQGQDVAATFQSQKEKSSEEQKKILSVSTKRSKSSSSYTSSNKFRKLASGNAKKPT